MAKTVGVDLGTANTLICMKGSGIVVRSPSVVAVNRDSREIITQGAEAKKMLGRTPAGIEAFRPMKDGVITDAEVTAGMLRNYLSGIGAISIFSRPTIIACIPFGVTEVEKRAMEDAAFRAGARKVSLIDEPLAAALGTGLKIGGPQGTMIVDVGGGTTEVAVISLGGIVASNSIRVAGDEMDEAIVSYLRRNRGVLIGNTTAEGLKIRLGSVHPDFDRGSLTVYGMSYHQNKGVPLEVSSAELRDALLPSADAIIGVIRKTMEETPPELSSDLYDMGIVLTGGGSLLAGLGKVIFERTGIKVRMARNPMDSVCNGILRVISIGGELEELLHYRER